MENYERLIINDLGDNLTPKAKYERLKMLIARNDLYNKALESLNDDIEWFGIGHPRHKQAKRTLNILTTGKDEDN